MNQSKFIRYFSNNPIIRPDMLKGDDGENINGPSIIRTPHWLPNPLGKYYLYFAHHHGSYIRLAYADDLEGPWLIWHPGSLKLTDQVACYDHIASPDVHIDHQNKLIFMFYHGVDLKSGTQLTFLAQSEDGINFNSNSSKPIANFYFRAVPYLMGWIGVAKGGYAYLSSGALDDFRPLTNPIFKVSDSMANKPGDIRHVALNIYGQNLIVYYTKIGDMPERIFKSIVSLNQDLENLVAINESLVIFPSHEWEGSHLPLLPSKKGSSKRPENAIRDPAFFKDEGRSYLLYSIAGEYGIGIVELLESYSNEFKND